MLKSAIIVMVCIINMYGLIHLGLYMVGANSYDILKFRKARQQRSAKPSGYRPLVSIIIPAHNEALVIRRTLDSVRASSYKHIEIIVVDDGSHDNTDMIVRDYVKHLPLTHTERYMAYTPALSTDWPLQMNRDTQPTNYSRNFNLARRYIRVPNLKIRTLRIRQRNSGKAAAMNNAIANYANGELMMCLDADSVLHPQAIAHAVRYFEDTSIIGVAANVRVMASKSWLSKLQRFEHLIGYRSKKFYTLTNSEYIIGGVASTYRTELVKQVGMYDTDTQTEDIGLSMKLIATQGNKGKRIVYASDVVAMTEGVQTFKALLRQRYRWKMGSLQNLFKYRQLFMGRDRNKYSRMLTHYRLPVALIGELLLILEPLVLAYVLYVSIQYRTFGILLGAYMTMTLYTLWSVWPDEHFTISQKLQLSINALGIYIVFYAMDLVQLSAVYKCLRNYKQIAHRQNHLTWVSPARTGQAASFSQ